MHKPPHLILPLEAQGVNDECELVGSAYDHLFGGPSGTMSRFHFEPDQQRVGIVRVQVLQRRGMFEGM